MDNTLEQLDVIMQGVQALATTPVPTAPGPTAADSGPMDERNHLATICPADPVLTSPAPNQKAVHAPPAPTAPMDGGLLDVDPLAVAATATGPAVPSTLKLVLTGQPFSGRKFIAHHLGAVILTQDEPILELATSYLRQAAPASALAGFVSTVRAWGNGEMSDKVPVTPARVLFTRALTNERWADFGTPGFWLKLMLDTANNAGSPVVVIGHSAGEVKTLTENGFQHWHVLCSRQSWQQRGGKQAATFASAIDKQVLQQLSGTRATSKLKCIWSDTAPVPSQRLHTLESFTQFISTPEVGGISVE